MQQFREIDARLQEVVPKIAEMNTICREVYRDNITYEPDIQTEVRPDGSKVSKVMVRVYPDRNNREESAVISWDMFFDKVYFDVKELYEEYETKNFDIDEADIERENDGEIFGWSLTDSWHHIGNVYYFLLAVFNLIETQKDETPIIDTKGMSEGKMNYGVTMDVLDNDRQTKLNMLEFENLNDCIGKYLRVYVELKRVMDIPEKYTFKNKCTYKFLDSEELFETKIVEKSKNPDFSYKATHEILITEDIIQMMMYNALTIGVYGMIESRRTDLQARQKEQSQPQYMSADVSQLRVDRNVPNDPAQKDMYIDEL